MKIRRVLKNLYLAIALAYWPCVCLGPLFMPKNGLYGYAVGLYFLLFVPLVLLPVFVIYGEVGVFVGQLTDGRSHSRREMIVGAVFCGLALLFPVSIALHLADGMPRWMEYARSSLLLICLWSLPILWCVGRIIRRERLHIRALVRPGRVWIPALVLVLLVLILGVLVFCGNHLDLFEVWPIGGRPDPLG